MRTILISGANRGIGRSIALRALKDGHRVSLGLRNFETIKTTNLDPNVSGSDRIYLHHYEAREPEDAKRWVNATLEHFKHIDSLINCAGIFHRTKFLFSSASSLIILLSHSDVVSQ